MNQLQKYNAIGCSTCPRSSECYGVGSCAPPDIVENFHMDNSSNFGLQKYNAIGCEMCEKSSECYGIGSCSPNIVENFEPLTIGSTTGAFCCHDEAPKVRPVSNTLNVEQCRELGGTKSVWQPSACFDDNLVENYRGPNRQRQSTYKNRNLNGAGSACNSCGGGNTRQKFANACQ
jgi:hypothetical protein